MDRHPARLSFRLQLLEGSVWNEREIKEQFECLLAGRTLLVLSLGKLTLALGSLSLPLLNEIETNQTGQGKNHYQPLVIPTTSRHPITKGPRV